MLFPKKVKHRKWQTGRKSPEKLARPDTRGITLAFGSYGLKATTPHRVTSNQIEAARKVLSRATGKGGKMWIRIFPDRPVTQKPAEVGMGKGKGDPKFFVFEVRPGRVMFEIDGVEDAKARDALRRAGAKLPVKTTVVTRAHKCKPMKKLNLKDASVEDMTKMLAEKREELRQLRFAGVSRTMKDTGAPKKLRADVARIMTELGSRAKNA